MVIPLMLARLCKVLSCPFEESPFEESPFARPSVVRCCSLVVIKMMIQPRTRCGRQVFGLTFPLFLHHPPERFHLPNFHLIITLFPATHMVDIDESDLLELKHCFSD